MNILCVDKLTNCSIDPAKWRHSNLWSRYDLPCCRAWCRTLRS